MGDHFQQATIIRADSAITASNTKTAMPTPSLNNVRICSRSSSTSKRNNSRRFSQTTNACRVSRFDESTRLGPVPVVRPAFVFRPVSVFVSMISVAAPANQKSKKHANPKRHTHGMVRVFTDGLVSYFRTCISSVLEIVQQFSAVLQGILQPVTGC